MLTASESIYLWLNQQRRPDTADLTDRYLAFGTSLETQVNVSPIGGEQKADSTSTFTDGTDEWFHFRIPKDASTNSPHWTDFKLKYNLAQRVDAIGCTGWDWMSRRSKWVGFDFDSIVGHAAGVGISDEQLNIIRHKVQNLDYVEIRRSTGGLGLHLYVYLDDIPCENHTQHAEIGRCVLGLISEDINMDLLPHVDVCGGNMWIASRRATAENGGLGRIKAATAKIDLPANWHGYSVSVPSVSIPSVSIPSVSIPSVSVPSVSVPSEATFSQLTSGRTPLDPEHLAISNRLGELGCAVWLEDRLLQTHTKLLEQVHEERELKGVFKTNSRGTNTRQPNCFGFPLPNGVYRFVRFSQGTSEHASWKQDGRGWTTCLYNADSESKGASTGFDYEPFVRRVQNPDKRPLGWFVSSDAGWLPTDKDGAKAVLVANGCPKAEVQSVTGRLEVDRFTQVCIPFETEYPAPRLWNRSAPQYKYPNPVAGEHSTWNMMLCHVGKSLDIPLAENSWAQSNGVTTGIQYLQLWMASVLRAPFTPLPYLFLSGPENCGKSIYHEAFGLLVTTGYVKADRALTSEFNAELEGAVLAVVEEKDMQADPRAQARMKDCVTSPTIAIRDMYKSVYEVRNSTHWVQCANSASYCPIFDGDTRVTALYVTVPQVEVPKHKLIASLTAEASAFMYTLMNIELPERDGRLGLPAIDTQFKQTIAAGNRDTLSDFIADCCIQGGEADLQDLLNAIRDYAPHYSDNLLGKQLSQRSYDRYRKTVDGKKRTFYKGLTLLGAQNGSL